MKDKSKTSIPPILKDIISCLDLEMKTFLIFTNLWLSTNPLTTLTKLTICWRYPQLLGVNAESSCSSTFYISIIPRHFNIFISTYTQTIQSSKCSAHPGHENRKDHIPVPNLKRKKEIQLFVKITKTNWTKQKFAMACVAFAKVKSQSMAFPCLNKTNKKNPLLTSHNLNIKTLHNFC